MDRKLTIGLDLGTTGVKAVLFNTEGKVVCEGERIVTTNHPAPNRAEQDPVQIERLAREVLKEVVGKGKVHSKELLAVGISAAMHSVICVDRNLRPLSNMLIWSDGRADEQAKRLIQSVGKELYKTTGTPIHPMNPLVKFLWMKETGFDPFVKADYILSIKEYLLAKWFGERVIDYSSASATGLFNLRTFEWDDRALELAGIKREQLSRIVPPTYILQTLNFDIAEEIGIGRHTPFVIGAADGQLANLGSGAIDQGEVAITAGTSGAIRQFIRGVRISDNHDTFSYAFTKDLSIIGGPTNNGGIALQWLKELVEEEGDFDQFIEKAKSVPPGAEGVFFFPFVNGERAPLWNQNAKGCFFGLTVTHKKEHLIRSVLEGISFNIYQIGKSLEKLAGKPEKIFVNGGLSRSKRWVQILADVFGQEMILSETHHSAAWGAAWNALVGIGWARSYEDIKAHIRIGDIIEPNWQNHERYVDLYATYENLVKDLSKHF